jgi:hypothetical protein
VSSELPGPYSVRITGRAGLFSLDPVSLDPVSLDPVSLDPVIAPRREPLPCQIRSGREHFPASATSYAAPRYGGNSPAGSDRLAIHQSRRAPAMPRPPCRPFELPTGENETNQAGGVQSNVMFSAAGIALRFLNPSETLLSKQQRWSGSTFPETNQRQDGSPCNRPEQRFLASGGLEQQPEPDRLPDDPHTIFTMDLTVPAIIHGNFHKHLERT